jgi:hypothetical protein
MLGDQLWRIRSKLLRRFVVMGFTRAIAGASIKRKPTLLIETMSTVIDRITAKYKEGR